MTNEKKYIVKAGDNTICTTDTLEGIEWIAFSYIKTSNFKGEILVYNEKGIMLKKFMIK